MQGNRWNPENLCGASYFLSEPYTLCQCVVISGIKTNVTTDVRFSLCTTEG